MMLETALAELQRLPIRAIVMGGSAGGIDALRTILAALPTTLHVPILVVLHLGVGSKSAWSVVFSHCRVPVCEAEDKAVAMPGTVTFSPPDYHLLVDGCGTLSLSIDAPVQRARPSIDVLFESAAWAYGTQVLGIVLSGANADGASGLRMIRDAGGACWVQNPDMAFASMMPRAAAAAVPDARVLSLEQMADILKSWTEGRERHG